MFLLWSIPAYPHWANKNIRHVFVSDEQKEVGLVLNLTHNSLVMMFRNLKNEGAILERYKSLTLDFSENRMKEPHTSLLWGEGEISEISEILALFPHIESLKIREVKAGMDNSLSYHEESIKAMKNLREFTLETRAPYISIPAVEKILSALSDQLTSVIIDTKSTALPRDSTLPQALSRIQNLTSLKLRGAFFILNSMGWEEAFQNMRHLTSLSLDLTNPEANLPIHLEEWNKAMGKLAALQVLTINEYLPVTIESIKEWLDTFPSMPSLRSITIDPSSDFFESTTMDERQNIVELITYTLKEKAPSLESFHWAPSSHDESNSLSL